MRRLFRRAFQGTAAASVALLVATCVLWARQVVPPRGYAVTAPSRERTHIRTEDWSARVQLARHLPEARFDNATLADVLDFLGDVSPVRLLVNWRAVEAAGVRRDTPVVSSAREETLGQVLGKVLTPLGLSFAGRKGCVYVSTPRDLKRIEEVMRPLSRLLSPADERAAMGLRRRVGWHDGDEASGGSSTLGQLLARVSRDSGLHVEVDWPALGACGVTANAVVEPGKGWCLSAGDALSMAVRHADPTDGVHSLQYEIRDGGVRVSTRNALDREARARGAAPAVAALALAAVLLTPCARRRRGLSADAAITRALALAIVAVALWLWNVDGLSVAVGDPTHEGAERWSVGPGTLLLCRRPADDFVGPGDWPGAPAAGLAGRVGIRVIGPSVRNGVPAGRGFAVPCRTAAGAFLLLPAARAGLRLRGAAREKGRRSAGRCRSCGYDLRATPEPGGPLFDRCPECGAAVNADTTA